MVIRLFAFLLLISVLSSCSEPSYQTIDNHQLKIMLDQKVAIYDIRRPEEWRKTGVIKGSKLLTYVDSSGRVLPDFLRRFTADIDKNDSVILICRTGNRTRVLARYLSEKMGYTNVYNVGKGITQWKADNRPVARLF